MFDGFGLGNILRSGQHTAKVRTNSVLNPLLWLVPIVVALLIAGIFFIDDEFIDHLFAVLIFLVVIAPLLFFTYFTFKDPDRLQSETFRLNKLELEMRGKDMPPPTPEDLIDIADPDAKAIEHKDD